MMRWFRVFGMFVVALTLASCAGSKAKSQLLGRWEVEDGKGTIEFMSDGTLRLGGNTSALPDWKVIKLFRDFDLQPARNSLTYSVVDKDHLEIQADYTRLLEGLSHGGKSGSAGKPPDVRPKELVTFALSGDELTLSSSDGKPTAFRRSR
jgi:hypothetical protein